MIYISLVLSILNTLWIITFTYFMYRLFRKLQPMLKNLQNFPIYGIMGNSPTVSSGVIPEVKSEVNYPK